MLHRFIFILLIVSCKQYAEAQSIAVTPLSLDEELRSLQLVGKISSSYSLTIRPLNFSKKFTSDSLLIHLNTENKSNPLSLRTFKYWGKFGQLSILPFDILSKMNTHHPHGWSDGIMIPASGLQTVLRAGFFSKFGPLEVQIVPEYFNANNPEYEKTKDYGSADGSPYKGYYWGQSAARINLGAISLGVSGENLWWGPGQFSSLTLSNNAPGFLHFTFNTTKPLKTPIGTIEWQLISGELKDSMNLPDEIFHLKKHSEISRAIATRSKYINSLNLVYNPKFFKNIFLGVTRSFTSPTSDPSQSLNSDNNFVRKYLPVFDKLFKSNLVNEDSRPWNQIASVYSRLLFLNSQSELYFEYGWNDHSYNMRDFIMSPFHSASYLVGFKKVVKLNNNSSISFSSEINQMEQSVDSVVRDAGSWYIHWHEDNYTNASQILGSGIGFGSNLVTLSTVFSHFNNRYGLKFQKLQHDPQVHVSRWSDLICELNYQTRFKKIIFKTSFSSIFSKNYGWKQNAERVNLMGMLSASYYW